MELYETSGASSSFWMNQKPLKEYSPLESDATADVCIIGGGITGLTSAYCLLKAGLSVILIDDGPICGGETCRTTAHLSFALDDHYFELEKFFGYEGAAQAAESHQAAIDFIEKIIEEEKISCGFERLDAYLFVPPCESLEVLQKEIKATHQAGLKDVVWVDRVPWSSYDSGPALKFPRQAQFFPLAYLERLTEIIEQKGCRIYTGTHAEKVLDGSPCKVKIANGREITAKSVIVATNSPINLTYSIHTKQSSYRTYVIAGKIPSGIIEKALYYDTPDPYHYLRIVEQDDGLWLIIGGEDHRTGENKHPEDCYDRLESWTKQRFPSYEKTTYKWSGQVIEPIDSLAFIGRSPDEKNVYLSTGDSGNGLTHGTIAGMLITDLITKGSNRWEKLYDPSRINYKAAKEFIEENADTFFQYRDWLTPEEIDKIDKIPAGSGAILSRNLKKFAVYRSEDGQLHIFSAVCPHLKGIVRWNDCEKSWDCPCHGSRFNPMGEVVNAPANQPLEKIKGSELD